MRLLDDLAGIESEVVADVETERCQLPYGCKDTIIDLSTALDTFKNQYYNRIRSLISRTLKNGGNLDNITKPVRFANLLIFLEEVFDLEFRRLIFVRRQLHIRPIILEVLILP